MKARHAKHKGAKRRECGSNGMSEKIVGCGKHSNDGKVSEETSAAYCFQFRLFVVRWGSPLSLLCLKRLFSVRCVLFFCANVRRRCCTVFSCTAGFDAFRERAISVPANFLCLRIYPNLLLLHETGAISVAWRYLRRRWFC